MERRSAIIPCARGPVLFCCAATPWRPSPVAPADPARRASRFCCRVFSMQEAGTDGLTCMRGDDRTPSVLVPEEMMATFDCDEFLTSDTRSAAHAAIVTRCMPTNSKSCSGVPSTPRHSAMASRMRSIASSRERACVWHAGIWGTEAT